MSLRQTFQKSGPCVTLATHFSDFLNLLGRLATEFTYLWNYWDPCGKLFCGPTGTLAILFDNFEHTGTLLRQSLQDY